MNTPRRTVSCLALLLVGCGARSDIGGYCDLQAVAFCTANGCPTVGPTSDFNSWCATVGSFGTSVRGLATCGGSTDTVVLTNIEAVTPNNNLLNLYYDQTGDLVAVVVNDGTVYGGTCLDLANYLCAGVGETCP